MQLVPSPIRRHVVSAAAAAVLLAPSLGIGGVPNQARAGVDTIEVTTTEDELNADGDCSLREAVVASNTDAPVDACQAGTPGGDTIVLQPLVYSLSIPGRDEDAAATGDLDIVGRTAFLTSNYGLDGWATIDAAGLDRAFDSAPAAAIGFTHVVITGGDAGDEDGGGVRLAGGVCSAGGGSRLGGIFDGVTIRDNVARRGGGIHVGGCLNPWIRGLSVVRNTATLYGGGISASGPSAIVPRVSTVSNNVAGDAGGGLWLDLAEDGGQAYLSHVTLAANTAPDGAGVWSATNTGVDATVIADHGGGPACAGPGGFYIGGLTDDETCLGALVSDAGLGPLTQIGPQFVHPLEPNSPAIDLAGEPYPQWCEAENAADQLGRAWPFDGDGDGLAWCDYGSVEAPAVAADHARITVSTTEDEVNSDGDCSLREAVIAANTNAPVDACPAGRPLTNVQVNADEIVVPAGRYVLARAGRGEDAAAAGDLDITEAVVVTGSGGPIIDGGGIDRVLDIAADVDAKLSGISIMGGDAGTEDGGAIRLNDSACQPGGNLARAVFLDEVVLESNRAARGGAAHVGDCTYLNVSRSSIAGNAATSGAGVSLIGNAQLTGQQSTFTGNVAEDAGGAVWGDFGGAVPGVSFEYATIAGNQAPSGSAVWAEGDPLPATSTYVVIADNEGTACVGWGELFVSITDDASCDGAEVVADAEIGPATQIGRMIVHVPETGSPVIDVSDESPCGFPYAPTDQVGRTRPQDGDGDGTATCDAGAIEAAGVAGGPTLPDTAMAGP